MMFFVYFAGDVNYGGVGEGVSAPFFLAFFYGWGWVATAAHFARATSPGPLHPRSLAADLSLSDIKMIIWLACPAMDPILNLISSLRVPIPGSSRTYTSSSPHHAPVSPCLREDLHAGMFSRHPTPCFNAQPSKMDSTFPSVQFNLALSILKNLGTVCRLTAPPSNGCNSHSHHSESKGWPP